MSWGGATRLAARAAVGGGGLGLIGGTAYGVLHLEGRIARHVIGSASLVPPDPSGRYGAHSDGDPIRLAVLGDSVAAGYGAATPEETFGAYLATGLSALADRPVRLWSFAAVGARTADLTEQIANARPYEPHIAAIIVGANDVTHRVRRSDSIAALRDAITRVRGSDQRGYDVDGGFETSHRPAVVLGTCPDLGTIEPLPPPLRQLARGWSRRLAAAQTVACVESGGHSVSLGSLLGPNFAAEPQVMFGPDRFHPSPAGYRSCAIAMLPTLANAIGVLPDRGSEPEPYRVEGVYTLARAAAMAASRSGSEVSELGGGGAERPTSHRALLLHRRRETIPAVHRPT
jgi:lysophospholipase L1-like esterase